MWQIGLPGDTMLKNAPSNTGDTRDVDSVPGSGWSPGVGNSNPLQSSCLENSMDREAWQLQSLGLQRVGHDWANTHIPHTKCMQNLVCPYQEHDVQKHILLLTLLSYYNQDSGTQDWRKEDEQQPLQNFFFSTKMYFWLRGFSVSLSLKS